MSERVVSKEAVSKVMSDYWGQYRSHFWQSLIAFTLPALGTVLVAYVPPLIVGNLVDIFVKNNNISLALATNYILLFGGLWALGEVFWRVGMYYLVKLETIGISNLSKASFADLVNRDYDFYTNNFVGSLSKKAFAYSRNFETFTDTLIFNILSNAIPLVFVTVVLWQYSPWIPVILLFCLVFVITISIPFIKKRSSLVAARHDAGSKLVGRLSDSVTNMFAVKSFAKEKREKDIYGEYVDDYSQKFRKAADYHNLGLELVLSPLYVGTNVIGLIAAIYFAKELGLAAGAVVVVFSYYSLITRIFWDINRTYRHIESSISEAAEYSQLFMEPAKIQDAPNAQSLKITTGKVQFDKISFNYEDEEDSDDSFLNDFSISIDGKQKVGLVGPSGGGKTTITKLLLRFIDPDSGEIRIDGQATSKVTQTSLREKIAYVPQEPLLFHRSLFENIAYGNPEASKREVIKAAKLAHADEFIEKLPDGYETLVGERGIKLSGGQRQRVAIARALLKKAPILVLDEATSSLDSESEKYIQQGLWELMQNKTALVIAHRLSTVKHLDRIIVLENGKIVQDGTHNELIKQKGLYAKLWGHQSGEVSNLKVKDGEGNL